MVDIRSAIECKRDGGTLPEAEIERVIAAAADGSTPDYQVAALLMAIYLRGLEHEELAHWTRAMLGSGRTLPLEGFDRPLVDKHSTGGVGDKASIPLGPAVAALGAAVPMISGRGLGHTGGTLDKLEAIPGFSTAVPLEGFRAALERTGLVFAGQSPELVPADRRLYALRDVTACVESLPLIASSILSKKLAEGLRGLVLDVKWGSGAFLSRPEQGRELARTMIELAGRLGLRAVVLQTNMARPLGRTIGHALEIRESIDCLRGGGPADLRELVVSLGAEMVVLAGLEDEVDSGRARLEQVLDDGSALDVLRSTVEAQGGDPAAIDDPTRLPEASGRHVVTADTAGHMRYDCIRQLGHAVVDLGGGRRRLEDAVDHGVGLVLLATEGEAVEVGQPLIEIHHDGRGLESAVERIRSTLRFEETWTPAPLIEARLT
ncbi:MAG: thymidine phosphorylase [Planctomycetota bacterium]|jgi:pyrimidine-nucleoside phosphorylase